MTTRPVRVRDRVRRRVVAALTVLGERLTAVFDTACAVALTALVIGVGWIPRRTPRRVRRRSPRVSPIARSRS